MTNGTKQNIALALLMGIGLSTGWFFVCYFLSQVPVVSPVSLARSFQPWWRHWPLGVILFVLPFTIVVALRVRQRLLRCGR